MLQNHAGTRPVGVFGAIDMLQWTMVCASVGINKMGAHCQSPKSMKRKFEIEEGCDDHSSVDDYDDEDDIKTFRFNTSSITL